MNTKFFKKNINVIIAPFVFAIGLVLFYYDTSTYYDFFMCSLLWLWLLLSGIALFYFGKKKKIEFNVTYFIFFIDMYFSIYLINLFLTRQIVHLAWMGPLIGSYFAALRDNHIKFSGRKFAALVLAITIAITGFFYVFDDSLAGVNRVERSVKRYLIKDKCYEKKDMEDVFYILYVDKSQLNVTVLFKDEPSVYYRYEIIEGKVVQVGVDAAGTNTTDLKHLENKDVKLNNQK